MKLALYVLFLILTVGEGVHAGTDKRKAPVKSQAAFVATHYQNLTTPALVLWVANDGEVYDPKSNNGVEYPAGSGKSLLFWSGFGISGYCNDTLQVSWNSDWQPGPLVSGFPADPSNPRYKVYKYRLGDLPAISQDTKDWPADLGAPFADLNGNGLYDPDSGDLPEIFGTQMLWIAANDGVGEETRPWKTKPIGIELQVSVFTLSDVSPELDKSVFLSWKLIHKGKNKLKNAVFSIIADPDIGFLGSDDLAGYDTTRSLGYCFNGTNFDQAYLSEPPALGLTLLAGPRVYTGIPTDSAQFEGRWVTGYRNSSVNSFIRLTLSEPGFRDPASAREARNLQMGLKSDSSRINPVIDGIGGLLTDRPEKMFPGVPESGLGWRDALGGDRRMMINTEPFDFAPGDTQFILAAILVGQGGSNLESIISLRSVSDSIKRYLPKLQKPIVQALKTGSLKLKLADHSGSGIQRASLSIVRKGDDFGEKRFYNFSASSYETVLSAGTYRVRAIGYDDVWGAIPDSATFDITIPANGILDTVVQMRRIPGYEDRFYGNFASYWKTGLPGDTSSVSPTVSWKVINGYLGWNSTVPKGKYTTEVSVDLTHYVYPVLSLDANYRLNGTGDTLYIYGSGDNGKSWTKLDSWQREWLTNWVFKSYDLSLLLQITDTVRIRFSLVKNSGSVTQMKLDNFKITHNGYTSVASESFLPEGVQLYPAYPNPFNPSTTLRWRQPVAGEAGIRIFNVLGQQVMTVQTGVLPAGESSLAVDFTGLSSGFYFYTLSVSGLKSKSGKLTVIR